MNNKILYIITHFALGGATETALYSAQGLIEKGWQVTILHGQDEAMVTEGSLVDKAQELGVPLVTVAHLCRPIRPGQDWRALWEIVKYIRQAKPAVVHTHSSKAGIVGRIAARMCGVPLIIHTVHGWSFNVFQRWPVRKTYQLGERLMARLSRYLVVVTKEDRAKGLSAKIGSPSQYRLIRSGIDLAHFNWQPKLDLQHQREQLGIVAAKQVIGTVGRLSEQKDPFTWLETALLIINKYPHTYFFWAGSGNLWESANKWIKAHNMEKSIKLLGTRNDIPELLACADLFLMTSRWEGLPRVLLQALAANLPVVATAVDGIQEVISDQQNGLLVAPKSPRQTAQAVERVLNEQHLRQQFLTYNQNILQEFSTNHMIKALDKLYRENMAS